MKVANSHEGFIKVAHFYINYSALLPQLLWQA